MFEQLADAVLAGAPAAPDDALVVLRADDAEVLSVVAAASRLRRAHFGNTVKVNYLVNLKSGLCQENCNTVPRPSVPRPPSSSTPGCPHRTPSNRPARGSPVVPAGYVWSPPVADRPRDIDRVTEIVGALKEKHPNVEVCACLGLLSDGQAERLSGVGVDAYNHNINTAESNHHNIVQTHTYADRVDTVEKAKGGGLSPCSGLIAGMGETDDQLVEALFALKALDADSIPINFLLPIDGTPFEDTWELSPLRCLKIMAMARFVCPTKEIRIAGGREMHLRSLQPIALHVANSIFLGDYLTTEGQAAEADLEMIRDDGFVVLGSEDDRARDEPNDPAIRRRGAGTSVVPNA